jgi:ribonuclease R
MKQAVYSPDNIGHFGLAYDAYTHFTSPIRRYPDLLTHRAIKAVLKSAIYDPKQPWDQLGMQCSATERRADEATRDVTAWLKCYYMKDRLGEEFAGTISGVTNFGIFVTLDDVTSRGTVHISELGGLFPLRPGQAPDRRRAHQQEIPACRPRQHQRWRGSISSQQDRFRAEQ